jgi:hypothetical protein
MMVGRIFAARATIWGSGLKTSVCGSFQSDVVFEIDIFDLLTERLRFEDLCIEAETAARKSEKRKTASA